MKITYTQVGDYLLPDIRLRTPQMGISEAASDIQMLGRYARMYRAHLREHHLVLYNTLLLTEGLYPLLYEVEETAQERRQCGVPEEIILDELVYD